MPKQGLQTFKIVWMQGFSSFGRLGAHIYFNTAPRAFIEKF
jgi:hypothetical protein